MEKRLESGAHGFKDARILFNAPPERIGYVGFPQQQPDLARFRGRDFRHRRPVGGAHRHENVALPRERRREPRRAESGGVDAAGAHHGRGLPGDRIAVPGADPGRTGIDVRPVRPAAEVVEVEVRHRTAATVAGANKHDPHRGPPFAESHNIHHENSFLKSRLRIMRKKYVTICSPRSSSSVSPVPPAGEKCIERREQIESENGRSDDAADHRNGTACPQLRAGSRPKRHRRHAENHRETRHEDRPELLFYREPHRLGGSQPRRLFPPGALHEQIRPGQRDTGNRHGAERPGNRERKPAQPERREHPGERRRQHKQHRQRRTPRPLNRRKQQIEQQNRHDGGMPDRGKRFAHLPDRSCERHAVSRRQFRGDGFFRGFREVAGCAARSRVRKEFHGAPPIAPVDPGRSRRGTQLRHGSEPQRLALFRSERERRKLVVARPLVEFHADIESSGSDFAAARLETLDRAAQQSPHRGGRNAEILHGRAFRHNLDPGFADVHGAVDIPRCGVGFQGFHSLRRECFERIEVVPGKFEFKRGKRLAERRGHCDGRTAVGEITQFVPEHFAQLFKHRAASGLRFRNDRDFCEIHPFGVLPRISLNLSDHG